MKGYTLIELGEDMSECKHELICPECDSSEVYFENAKTGSGKYTCQDCEFMGNKEDFNYSVPVKEFQQLETMRGALEEIENRVLVPEDNAETVIWMVEKATESLKTLEGK